MKIIISSDSTCDLSPELIEAYDINIIPLSVSMDGKFYKDGLEITPLDIFRHVSSGGGMCSTAAVNVEEYIDIFTALRQKADAVIHFTISAQMSSCFQNASLAASELDQVYVIDAENLSTGIGQLVLEAAIMARQGVAAKDITDHLNQLKKKLDVSFVLDTLEYLYKGGRCSGVAALGANVLKLRPSILVRNGKMGVSKKYRGPFAKCMCEYIKDRLNAAGEVDLHRVFVTHSGLERPLVDQAVDTVRSLRQFDEVCVTRAGCTISSHCGPGCIGVLFIRKQQY